jgi:hypothetical protein
MKMPNVITIIQKTAITIEVTMDKVCGMSLNQPLNIPDTEIMRKNW